MSEREIIGSGGKELCVGRGADLQRPKVKLGRPSHFWVGSQKTLQRVILGPAHYLPFSVNQTADLNTQTVKQLQIGSMSACVITLQFYSKKKHSKFTERKQSSQISRKNY